MKKAKETGAINDEMRADYERADLGKMTRGKHHKPDALPAGWFWTEEPERSALEAEYELELPEIHPLYGIEVSVVAHRDATDDILVRHDSHGDRVSVVHLTWAKRKELPNHPGVEFTGSHEEFLQWEFETYGVGIDQG
jgi:hypothetical protein